MECRNADRHHRRPTRRALSRRRGRGLERARRAFLPLRLRDRRARVPAAGARRRGRVPGGVRAHVRAARLVAGRRRDQAMDRPADAQRVRRPAAFGQPRGADARGGRGRGGRRARAARRRAHVHEGMRAISPNCREILDRFFARDESYRTIGEALGIPPGTIASRISRCLGKLRAQLEGREPASDASGGL